MAAPYTLIVKRAAQPEPQNTRFNFGSRPSSSSSNNNANTRFFTGNGALDAGLAGAAAGFAGQYIANQVFNPCTRGGTRNKNTNNRIFGGNTGNFLLGAVGGFAGVAGNYLFNAVTNPCRSGNRNNNKGTNNRIFGGNTGNFLLGAVGGFAGAQLFNNAQGNPCNNLFSGR